MSQLYNSIEEIPETAEGSVLLSITKGDTTQYTAVLATKVLKYCVEIEADGTVIKEIITGPCNVHFVLQLPLGTKEEEICRLTKNAAYQVWKMICRLEGRWVSNKLCACLMPMHKDAVYIKVVLEERVSSLDELQQLLLQLPEKLPHKPLPLSNAVELKISNLMLVTTSDSSRPLKLKASYSNLTAELYDNRVSEPQQHQGINLSDDSVHFQSFQECFGYNRCISKGGKRHKKLLSIMKQVIVLLTLGAASVFMIKFHRNRDEPTTLKSQPKQAFYANHKDQSITITSEDGDKVREDTVTLSDFVKFNQESLIMYDKMFWPYTWEDPASEQKLLNTFGGFQASPLPVVDKDSFKLIKKHILEVLCNSCQESYRYLIKLMALVVQKPDEKPGICPIFVGEQGCGKNTFWEEGFGRMLIGPAYTVLLNDIEQLVGKFNKITDGRKLIIGDEVKGFGKNRDKLKSIITGKNEVIEMKGVDSQVRSSSSTFFVMLTNCIEYFKLDQHDRRHPVFECSNKHCNDPEYFEPLYEEVNSQHSWDNFYSWLLRKDIRYFNKIKEIPNTEIRQQILESSRHHIEVFLECFVESHPYSHYDPEMKPRMKWQMDPHSPDKKGYYHSKIMYEAYREWHTNTKCKDPELTKIAFTKYLKDKLQLPYETRSNAYYFKLN